WMCPARSSSRWVGACQTPWVPSSQSAACPSRRGAASTTNWRGPSARARTGTATSARMSASAIPAHEASGRVVSMMCRSLRCAGRSCRSVMRGPRRICNDSKDRLTGVRGNAPMIHLYWHPFSIVPRRVRIVLREKRIPHEEVEVDVLAGAQRGPEFRRLNPFGQIPVLEDAGLVICESVAILEYLEERFPSPRLLPAEAGPRAITRQFMLWSGDYMNG